MGCLSFGRACVATLLVGACLACAKQEQKATDPAPAVAMKPAPATPIDVKKVELGGNTWDPQWDVLVEQALPAEMLSRQVPKDVRRFCPRFYEMHEDDKRAFWAYFFQALAGAEAGLDPTTNVRHSQPETATHDTVTHRAVRSEGLLQVAYEDHERYGCDFDWQADKTLKADDPGKTILQPKNNLTCGLKILENQIFVQHKPLLSASGYWATLRPGTSSYQMFAKQMTNPPVACGLGEKAEAHPGGRKAVAQRQK